MDLSKSLYFKSSCRALWLLGTDYWAEVSQSILVFHIASAARGKKIYSPCALTKKQFASGQQWQVAVQGALLAPGDSLVPAWAVSSVMAVPHVRGEEQREQ